MRVALPKPTQDDIAWALSTFSDRRSEQRLYRDYMRGIHRPQYMTRQYSLTFQQILQGLRLNICPSVIHAVTDRLNLIGFTGNDQADDQVAQIASSIWRDQRLDRHSNQVHNEALVSGDSYLIVWPGEDNRPRFYPQQGMDMVARYGNDEQGGVIVLAARLWQQERRYRLNLYYADRTEKYITTKDIGILKGISKTGLPTDMNTFEQYDVLDEPWPLPNQWGEVPVFHFAFDAGIGECGISELRDVIPIQDAINKELCDMIVASEFGAFRQRWMTGGFAEGEPKYDANGRLIVQADTVLRVGVDRFLNIPNPEAKFGEFSETPLANFINTIDSLMSDVARIKGIPLHEILMSGTFPSGESQKTAETRLVAKVKDTQIDFGDVWEDALGFALKIQGVENAMIASQWENPESRSELAHLQGQAIKAMQLGVPETQIWREEGYTEEDIAKFSNEKQVSSQAQQASAADALARLMNQG
jgi:hypothetical protein